jgi:hypothetical protein
MILAGSENKGCGWKRKMGGPRAARQELLALAAGHSFFQLGTHLEFDYPLGRDFQRLSGRRVAASACGTLLNGKGAEADHLHVVATRKRILDNGHECIEHFSCLGFGVLRNFGYSINQFAFIHVVDSQSLWLKSNEITEYLIRSSQADFGSWLFITLNDFRQKNFCEAFLLDLISDFRGIPRAAWFRTWEEVLTELPRDLIALDFRPQIPCPASPKVSPRLPGA